MRSTGKAANQGLTTQHAKQAAVLFLYGSHRVNVYSFYLINTICVCLWTGPLPSVILQKVALGQSKLSIPAPKSSSALWVTRDHTFSSGVLTCRLWHCTSSPLGSQICHRWLCRSSPSTPSYRSASIYRHLWPPRSPLSQESAYGTMTGWLVCARPPLEYQGSVDKNIEKCTHK